MFSQPIKCMNRRSGNMIRGILLNRTPIVTSIIGAKDFNDWCGKRFGIENMRDPRSNKGLAYSLEERQALGIHGLMPARFKTQEEQLELCLLTLKQYKEPIQKYMYLTDLHDRNERLYYRLISENIHDMLPIVYTPTVGLACQRYGLMYRRPHGLFITYHDRGYIHNVIQNWPEIDVRAIVVTDGERILGLGDLGSYGMGIPIGKMALYTALAGIHPYKCLPILLDVGTNNETLLEDPLYVGLRQKRITGKEYEDFMEEFMQAVVQRYGQHTLIQFEDFGNHNAFLLLEKYRNFYCTFNDDIQGTAGVALSGLYSACRVINCKVKDSVYLFAGAGEAALGIADLTCKALISQGLSEEEARSKIWMIDIDGLLTTTRKEGDLAGMKKKFAKDVEPMKDLLQIVEKVKPNALIGATAAAGLFKPEILRKMAEINERPIIFALSNPTSKAECTAQEAYTNTDGRVIFSSGSPFPPVEYNGKVYTPGQGNNAYIFPGVALGVLASASHHIPDEMFLVAAEVLSEFVSEEDIKNGTLYPPLDCIRIVSLVIAEAVAKVAYEKGLASLYPRPKDFKEWLDTQQYDYNYNCALPVMWPWPRMPYHKTTALDTEKLVSGGYK